MKKLFVLASRSPRRKELLESIGLDFVVDFPDFEEIAEPELSAHELVLKNAEGKAESIATKYPNALILGVDTVVAVKDHILEKPLNHKDAVRMVKLLSGNSHEVLTALCIIDTKSQKKLSHVETTKITFTKMTDEEIENYVSRGESMDKSGAYAAQGIGALFVKAFDGDYFNVVGLPIYRLNIMLKEFDVNLMDLVV